jgi:hypothetical protein
MNSFRSGKSIRDGLTKKNSPAAVAAGLFFSSTRIT